MARAFAMDAPCSQQDFLRGAMEALQMTRNQFATRIGAKRRALDNWLLPTESKGHRAMPEHLWKFVAEITAHEPANQ